MRCTSVSIASVSIAVVLFAAGCQDSTVPLSHPDQSKPDERLYGIWQHVDEHKEEGYFVVGRLGGNAPEAVMRMVGIILRADGELVSREQWLLFPTTLGENSYLSVAMLTQEEIDQIYENGCKNCLPESYIIVRYRVTDDTVLIWETASDFKTAAIQSGKIQGEVTAAYGFKNYRFADTMEKLAEFVTSADDKLFSGEPLQFRRLK